jgi:hypothetical protein
MTTGKPAAAKAAANMAGPKATKMPTASAPTACERKGSGRHHRRAEGKRCSNDNHRFERGVR